MTVVLHVLLQVPKSALFDALEKISTTNRIEYDAELEMMPEGMYVKHVTKVLTEMQGKLTRLQAANQWCPCLHLLRHAFQTVVVLIHMTGG